MRIQLLPGSASASSPGAAAFSWKRARRSARAAHPRPRVTEPHAGHGAARRSRSRTQVTEPHVTEPHAGRAVGAVPRGRQGWEWRRTRLRGLVALFCTTARGARGPAVPGELLQPHRELRLNYKSCGVTSVTPGYV